MIGNTDFPFNFQFIFKTVCPTVILGYSIMITTDFSTKKFFECDYRIQHDIRDCSECDIAFECEEHSNSFEDFEPQEEEKFDLFETIAAFCRPANVAIADILPC
jgi:hypothetical protein